MVVFTLVFNRFLGVKSPDPSIPYAVFSFSGLVPWQFFAGALSRSSVSLVGNANLITKVYFPRLVIPAASVLAGLVDLAISFVVLMGMIIAYHIPLSPNIVFVPLFVVFAILTALAVSLWLSALDVMYRDVQYLVPFLVQIWMFVSPVIYPIDKILGGAPSFRLRLEPYDRSDRWLPLGPPRRAAARRLPLGFGSRRRRPAPRGAVVLQDRRTRLRRRGVSNNERDRRPRCRPREDVPYRRATSRYAHAA